MEELEQKKGYWKKMNQTKYILFLTNLEDEILVKGGRICNTRNLVLGISRRNQSKMSLMDNYTLEFTLSKINSKI